VLRSTSANEPPEPENGALPDSDVSMETTTMPAHATQTQLYSSEKAAEGVTVVGEAVRAVQPEGAEFLIEITSTATTATQALASNQAKTTQILQSAASLGVQQADVQTISLNLYSVYSPVTQTWGGPQQILSAFSGVAQPLPVMGGAPQTVSAYAALPQIGQASPLSPYSAASPAQSEIQYGSYQARSTLRVNVREVGRLGEIADTVARAGATAVGGFSFRTADDTRARRMALEAAAKDARAKAESLAAAVGRQIGDPVVVSEDVLASNGADASLRSAFPLAFGVGAPNVTGAFEYYARVSVTFRLQAG
jgi:uncharacterized protein YggE